MKRITCVVIASLCLGFLIGAVGPDTTYAGPETTIGNLVVAQTAAAPTSTKANKALTLGMFILIIAITLCIVFWAAQRTKTTADFYAARSSITAYQNGWAIAGDYMSAATFLGMAGLISLNGLDGFLYPTGWMVAFVTVLLVMAEPCRNSGKYTMGDVLCFRSSPKPVRACAAITTLAVSTFYLTAQMVGAGKLMELLVGIPYTLSVVVVGCLIIVYVIFGGMIATTWVQIIKAALLVGGGVVLSILVLAKLDFNPVRLFDEVATSPQIQEWVRIKHMQQAVPQPGFDYGQRFLEPGLFLKNVWDQVSLGMATCLGTAGMPHILMRFFTVPDAQAARKSVVVSMFLIATFFILTTVMGYGAALFLTPQGIVAVDPSGNMANPLLARYLGNWFHPLFGDFLQAFVCAVAFATILAVVSGLVLASSAAISHDIYTNVIKDGKAEQTEQIKAARITSAVVGTAGVLIALAAETQNVAHLVALAFAVAAAGNLPTVVLSLFWKKMSTAGICAGLLVGTFVGIGLVLVSPNVQYPKLIAAADQKIITTLEKKQTEGVTLSDKDKASLEKAKVSYEKNKDGTSIVGLDKPLFPLRVPAIVCIPAGLFAAIFFALLFPSKREEEAFDELYVRQNTGIGVSAAIGH
ncbi:MAG: cation acetate symporter [Desulfomonile tiedjei]|uniref:Cation acetate symporter n=1 Tax=Desulfomonile tiedjei TaxID=2358 RepID=A0A9D6Z5I0_9BACT|nr:cation acetate symporter [Desulfomonile tiedjei]